MKYLWVFLLFSTQLAHAEKEYRVAFVGNNYTQEWTLENLENPFLQKLFFLIRTQKPQAVFLMGNLSYELSSGTEGVAIFKKRLEKLTEIKNKYLGPEIPVYPILGNSQTLSYEIIETFREHFDIHKISPRPPYHLAYTVAIDGAEFIVLATGFDEPDVKIIPGIRPSLPILNWLEKHLEENKDNFKYRFVIGNLPAFSSTGSEGHFLGLDKDPIKRDVFWNILRKNHVNGYLSSHEALYDRSNRDGIWQIVSGGIVKYAGPDNKKFSHFLMMTWGGEHESPILEAVDLDGRIWDEFKVTPLNFPVHQMRISEKLK